MDEASNSRSEPTAAAPTQSDEGADRHDLLTALTTEHFALQGARAATINESTSRATLFVGALSSALVALGFSSRASGTVFTIFLLVVLPTLYILGTFTVARLVALSIEDIGYGRAINRIRTYYLERAGDQGRYFLLNGHDDTLGVLANMGVTKPSRWQLSFTLASMISVLNAVVGGTATAYLAHVLHAALAVSVVVGALTALASGFANFRWQRTMHDQAREHAQVLYPSPTTTRARGR